MNFTFIQLAEFAGKWRKSRLNDEDLRALERQIAVDPLAGDLMRGAGGLRKIRFAPPSRHSGKSGAYRVCYTIFPANSAIYLFTIFAKKDQANLTPAENNRLKKVIEALERISRKDSR
jgi:hypothetical protein